MTQCSALRDDLAEATLGASVSEALQHHLRECEPCVAQLARQRELVGRMDATVSAFVRRQPSPHILTRTMTAVRSATGQRSTTARERPWTGWVVAGALAASVLGVTFGIRTIQSPAPIAAEASAVEAWRSPTDALLTQHDSVLEAPLHDFWFDSKPSASHSSRIPGGTHGA